MPSVFLFFAVASADARHVKRYGDNDSPYILPLANRL